jgi:sortase (surface protein transpeptidase)
MQLKKFCFCCFLLAIALLGSSCSQETTPVTHAAPTIRKTPLVVKTKHISYLQTPEPNFRPERLIIPAIGINTNVEEVGIQPDGELGTPKSNPWDDVGWYAEGPVPGVQGSAVIDGHLDRPGGYPAVFWNLRYLRIGDEILVTNRAGKTLHFKVYDIARYSPQNAPLQQIFGNQNGVFLNLITCAGYWIPSEKQTTERLVVYSVLS